MLYSASFCGMSDNRISPSLKQDAYVDTAGNVTVFNQVVC